MVKAQTYSGVTRVLRAHGWVLLRRAKGSHEIWAGPAVPQREPLFRTTVWCLQVSCAS